MTDTSLKAHDNATACGLNISTQSMDVPTLEINRETFVDEATTSVDTPSPIICEYVECFEQMVQYLDLDDLRTLPLVSSAHRDQLAKVRFQHLDFHILEAPLAQPENYCLLAEAEAYVHADDRDELRRRMPNWANGATYVPVNHIDIHLPDYIRRWMAQCTSIGVHCYHRRLGKSLPPSFKRYNTWLKYGGTESPFHNLICTPQDDLPNSVNNDELQTQQYSKLGRHFNPQDDGHKRVVEDLMEMRRVSTQTMALPEDNNVIKLHLQSQHDQCRPGEFNCHPVHRYGFQFPHPSFNTKSCTQPPPESHPHAYYRKPRLANLPIDARRVKNLQIVANNYDDFGCHEWRNSVVGCSAIPRIYDCFSLCQDSELQRLLDRGLPPKIESDEERVLADNDEANMFIPGTHCLVRRTTREQYKHFFGVGYTDEPIVNLHTHFPNITALDFDFRDCAEGRTTREYHHHMSNLNFTPPAPFASDFLVDLPLDPNAFQRLTRFGVVGQMMDAEHIASFIHRNPSIRDLSFAMRPHITGTAPEDLFQAYTKLLLSTLAIKEANDEVDHENGDPDEDDDGDSEHDEAAVRTCLTRLVCCQGAFITKMHYMVQNTDETYSHIELIRHLFEASILLAGALGLCNQYVIYPQLRRLSATSLAYLMRRVMYAIEDTEYQLIDDPRMAPYIDAMPDDDDPVMEVLEILNKPEFQRFNPMVTILAMGTRSFGSIYVRKLEPLVTGGLC